MTPDDLKLLRDVQAADDREHELKQQIESFRNLASHQFDSVKGSVEHVISELLQNADDAEATRVRINYRDSVFTFQHNGHDFSDEQFRAICSFAVSSKRTFKTTGFRGIGFKSTFSLGYTVQLITPRFQVKFERERFTYPIELDREHADPDFRITVRVSVIENSRSGIESSLNVWRSAPCSLLFFKNLGEGVTIDEDHFVVHRAEASGLLNFITKNGVKIWGGHLLSSKSLIQLPQDACHEIAGIRRASNQWYEDATTQLDLLLSEEEAGRIYSILPTSSERRLHTSFAINGCFVLMPQRDAIVCPSQSSTNRFLFAEAGRMVAHHLIQELELVGAGFLAPLKRAYKLLPLDEGRDKAGAETEATRKLRATCLDQLKDKPWVVTADLSTVCPGKVKLVDLPTALNEVWPPDTLRRIFAPDAHIIHPDIPETVVKWLQANGHLIQPTKNDLLRALTKPEIPKPERRDQLFNLWAWAARTIISSPYLIDIEVRSWSAVNILPAEGESFLKSLDDVFNFSKETADNFTSGSVTLSGLGVYRLDADFVTPDDLKLKNPPQSWWAMMDCATVAITKEDSLASMLASASGRISQRLDARLPCRETLKALWRIYQDAGIALDSSLPVLRENGEAISVSKRQLILRSESLDIALYVPRDTIERVSLDYSFYLRDEQERERCCEWLTKDDSGQFFPKPIERSSDLVNGYQAQEHVRRLGGNLTEGRNGSYTKVDYDWPKKLLVFWATKSKDIPDFFERLVKLAIEHHGDFLKKNRHITFQRNYGGSRSNIESRPQVPCSWARYFWDKPCLRSKAGELRKPSELYISKPSSTLFLINAGEAVVSAELQEVYGEELLTLLGCRSTLPGLAELTQIIKSGLDSKSADANRMRWLLLAANEVFRHSSDEDQKRALLSLLADHSSIPSEAGKLERPEALVQEAGEENMDPVLARDLRETAIVAALGVRQTPGREADIAWLNQEIGSGAPLPPEKLRRLKKILARQSSVSEHLWNQRKWLALDGAVRSLDNLLFRHADREELPVEAITSTPLLERTADFTVISPIPDELRAFSKPNLLDRLEKETRIGGNVVKSAANWLGNIAQVLWTEAESAGPNQAELESIAMRWRLARVMLDPVLSRSFTLDGVPIAKAIALDAEWMDEDCLVIRAGDDDEVCDVTEQITRRLRESLGNLRPKTGGKLGSLVDRTESQITKVGLKAIRADQLRPWPAPALQSVEQPAGLGDDESEAVTAPKAEVADASAEAASNELTCDGESPTEGKTRAENDVFSDDRSSSITTRKAIEQSDLADAEKQTSLNAEFEVDLDELEHEASDESRRTRGQRSYAKDSGERNLPNRKGPSPAASDSNPPPQSGDRMRSYVEHSLDRRERERQRTQAQEDGAAAEKIVVMWEQKHGRAAKRLGGNNPGFDIISKSNDGREERFIEVKSIAGEWGGTGVRMTPRQFACAEERGDSYWLYVVEDAKTERPIVHAIQNPAAHISAFCFDCGWREIAEAPTKEKPPSLFVPKVGDTVLFDEHEVIVAKVETRGAFVLATFTLDGRTYRKMNTALLPKE